MRQQTRPRITPRRGGPGHYLSSCGPRLIAGRLCASHDPATRLLPVDEATSSDLDGCSAALFGLSDRGEQVVAGLFAAAASCRAETTMLMVAGVPLALLTAGSAGGCTSLDRCAEDTGIGFCLAREDPAGRLTSVGAVETKADTADQSLDVVLAETCVGATGASGGAVEAVVDAAHERLAIRARWMWMCLDELLDGHFGSFLA